MKTRKKATNKQSLGKGIAPLLMAVLAAAALTIVLILLLALGLKMGILKDGAIPVANQIIKVLGIIVSSYLSTRRPGAHQWFRGLLGGVLYIIIGFIVFSIAAGGFELSTAIFVDILMGAAVGAIAALLLGKKAEPKK